MNTRCSGHEQILAPLVLALETGNEVVVVEVLQKLLANAQLHVLRRLQTLLLQRLNVGGNVDAANVALNRDPRLVDPPFRDDTIACRGPDAAWLSIRP